MSTVIRKPIHPDEYSNKDLQGASFKNEDLANINFSGSDLRGADFSGSNLSGADMTNARTGITSLTVILLFFGALAVSLLSGYIAMLAGRTIQIMMASTDTKVRAAGIISLVIILFFIIFSYLKGVNNAIKNLVIPVVILAVVIGIAAKLSGLGTGRGMLYLILALILVAVMFVVGTVARAAAGTLSSTILFVVVALGGGMFGKSIGGGLGTVIMAISCAVISKKALSTSKGFDDLKKIATFITRRFGTSFRNSQLAHTNFSSSKIHNADFTNADTTLVNWGDSKKANCISGNAIITDKKKRQKKDG
jgi:pentapeptide repeat protein